MLFLLLLTLALSPQERPPPPDSMFRAARAALDDRLLDYQSARFRDVRGNDFVICGFVNAKNRMGAYTGWGRFAYLSGEDPTLLVDDPSEEDDILLDAFCGDDGRKQTGANYTARIEPR